MKFFNVNMYKNIQTEQTVLISIFLVSSLFCVFYVILYFVLYPNLSVSIAVTKYLILGSYKRLPWA